jgi:hypothetical protein
MQYGKNQSYKKKTNDKITRYRICLVVNFVVEILELVFFFIDIKFMLAHGNPD